MIKVSTVATVKLSKSGPADFILHRVTHKLTVYSSSRRMPPKHSESREKELETATIEYEVPDGGYGWVVVVCAFIFISLPMGISASFGLYYEEWLEYFEAGKVHTSLVGSIGSGSVPLLGELEPLDSMFF